MTPISEYHRPATLDAALELLARPAPRTRPLGGGTHFRGRLPQAEALVDLRLLHLGGIQRAGNAWKLGAAATLEEVLQAGELPPALRRAAGRQAAYNARQRATLGGLVAAADSGPLLACLLALNTQVDLEPGAQVVPLDLFLANDDLASKSLVLSLAFNPGRRLGLAMLGRSPADVPILSVAVAATRAGDGLQQVWAAAGAAGQPWWFERQLDPADSAAALQRAAGVAWQDDVRASAGYRQSMLPVLLRRALAELELEVSREG